MVTPIDKERPYIFMKTLNELYNEVITSEELVKELESLNSKDEILTFAAKHGCDTTLDEIMAFLEEKQKAFGELSEEELEQVAGGKCLVKGYVTKAFLRIVNALYAKLKKKK